MSSLVALIIGAGANVGRTVALTLQKHQYKVVLGSRNPDVEALKKDGLFPVKVDATKPDSVVQAFKTVSDEHGPPNVVIFNAVAFKQPKVASDPLSVSLEDLEQSTDITNSIYAAAQQFRSLTLTSTSPRAFIVTGNKGPFVHQAHGQLFDLIKEKTIATYLIERFWSAYTKNKEDPRFHFAFLVSDEGDYPAYPDFLNSGPAHAEAYWHLISSEKPEGWDYRFTLSGKKYLKQ